MQAIHPYKSNLLDPVEDFILMYVCPKSFSFVYEINFSFAKFTIVYELFPQTSFSSRSSFFTWYTSSTTAYQSLNLGNSEPI